jgi:hypothetical protein
MSVIPWPYRLLALTALGVALVGFGWIRCEPRSSANGMPPSSNKPCKPPPSASGRAQATVKVVTQYVDRVRVVREKGDNHQKSRNFPSMCPLKPIAACTIIPWLCAHARRCRRR